MIHKVNIHNINLVEYPWCKVEIVKEIIGDMFLCRGAPRTAQTSQHRRKLSVARMRTQHLRYPYLSPSLILKLSPVTRGVGGRNYSMQPPSLEKRDFPVSNLIFSSSFGCLLHCRLLTARTKVGGGITWHTDRNKWRIQNSTSGNSAINIKHNVKIQICNPP